MKTIVLHFITLLLIFITGYQQTVVAQNTLYFQGFENTACPNADNWAYAGGAVNAETARSGSRSARVGRVGESNTLTLNNVDVSGYNDLKFSIYHRVRNGSGPGLDTREGAAILTSINGGAWTVIARVSGFGDANWNWGTTGAPAGGPSSGCNSYTMPNPVTLDLPANTSSFSVRIVSIRAGSCSAFNNAISTGSASNFDRSDEGFFIDDIRITTSSAVPERPGCVTLPVSFLSFTGNTDHGTGNLLWATASETNNMGFEIEKSLDGINFESIGWIDGAGTTQAIQEYSFIDQQFKNNAYYRLKQIDLDSQFNYSNTIYLQKQESAPWLHLYPVPSSGPLSLALTMDEHSTVTVDIYDMLSVTQIHTELSHTPGSIEHLLDLSSLANGTYIVSVVTSSGKSEKRAIQIIK